MYQFTNRFGETVDAPSLDNIGEAVGSDVRNLPLWVAAATEAEARNFCDHYDQIASAVGGPSRDDLRTLGLLPLDFGVMLTRRVPVTVYVTQTTYVEVKAHNREEAELKAQEPHVAYWAGGMYGDYVAANMVDPLGYKAIDTTRDIGEASVVPPDTGV